MSKTALIKYAQKQGKTSYQLTNVQKKEIINQQALVQSPSRYRRFCLNIRVQMILNPMRQFLFSMSMGILAAVAPMMSAVIIYRKFQSISIYDVEGFPKEDDDYSWDYSQAINPLIFLFSIITMILLASLYGILREIFESGVLVWHRDNLGKILSDLIFHGFLLRTLFLLKKYILLKENRYWRRDREGDRIMDFFEWVNPMFIFICLYTFKLSCLVTQYTVYKVAACLAFILLAVFGESHFDRSRDNDAPI